MTIKILLVDDHDIFLHGLKVLLENQGGVAVVGQASDGAAALQLIQATSPDVVIMDMSMAGMNGIEATRRIRSEFPNVKVLCLSMHSESTFIEAALDAGASAYLLKNCHIDELLGAIETVRDSRAYISTSVATTVLEALRARKATVAPGPFEVLTEREREVLQLIAEGHAARTIGAKLKVSAKTIGSHREHIMAKLGIDSVAGLTKYAIQHGLTSMDPHGSA